MGKRKNITEEEIRFYDNLGMRLKHARGKKGLSQRRMAEKLGRSNSHITDCERGVRSPTAYEIRQWAHLTGHTPNYFFDLEENLDLDEVLLARELSSELKKMSLSQKKTLLKLVKSFNEGRPPIQ